MMHRHGWLNRFYFYRALKREQLIQVRQSRVLVNAFLLFCMILLFFPLTIPADKALLRQVFPGLIWIALLFSFFLSAEHVFQQDEEDGVLEQWLISPVSIHIVLRAKLIIQAVIYILPILLCCPIVMILFDITLHELGVLMLSLLFGSPTILMFCALAASFSTGLKQKGVFMALIVLPLTLPVMILGSGTLSAAMHGLPISGELALLLAMSIFTTVVLPWVMGGVLRVCS
jgi:heme exporter protein B